MANYVILLIDRGHVDVDRRHVDIDGRYVDIDQRYVDIDLRYVDVSTTVLLTGQFACFLVLFTDGHIPSLERILLNAFHRWSKAQSHGPRQRPDRNLLLALQHP